MFYTSFDEETYKRWHDDEKCIEDYFRKQDEIRAVKKVVMEWIEHVEEARYYVEEALQKEALVDEIGDILDVERKQDDLDFEEEGIEADQLFQHLDRGDHNKQDILPSNDWCKKIDLKDDDQLCKEAQNPDRH